MHIWDQEASSNPTLMRGKSLPNQVVSLSAKVTVDLWTEPFLPSARKLFWLLCKFWWREGHFLCCGPLNLYQMNTCFWNHFLTMTIFVLSPPQITTKTVNKVIAVGRLSYFFFASRSSRVCLHLDVPSWPMLSHGPVHVGLLSLDSEFNKCSVSNFKNTGGAFLVDLGC